MTPPASVNVLGREFALVPVDGMVEAQQAVGNCNSFQHLIQYEPNQSPIELRDTVLHELIHATDYLMKAGMTERQVTVIATGLTLVFKDNPALVAFLTS